MLPMTSTDTKLFSKTERLALAKIADLEKRNAELEAKNQKPLKEVVTDHGAFKSSVSKEDYLAVIRSLEAELKKVKASKAVVPGKIRPEVTENGMIALKGIRNRWGGLRVHANEILAVLESKDEIIAAIKQHKDLIEAKEGRALSL